MATSYFVNQSMVGVDLMNGNATALFAVGTHVNGTNNSEWVYVQAATSVNAYTVCAFNSATFTCGMASGGDLSLGANLAVAQTSISAQAYGWVATRGVGLQVSQTGISSAGSTVYLAASAAPTGSISTSISASNTVQGIAVEASTSATYAYVNLSWPRGMVTTGL